MYVRANMCAYVCVCVFVSTISDQCPAGQHSSQHELGHSQQSAHEAADQGDAVEEVILNHKEKGDETECEPCVLVDVKKTYTQQIPQTA